MTTSDGHEDGPVHNDEWFDPRALIAQLDALSEKFAREAEAVQESMLQAAGEVRDQNLFVRVVAGRVEQLEVTQALGQRGPVQAREVVLAAFTQALVQSNRRGAASVAHVPGGQEAAGGYRDSLPPEASEAAEAYDADHAGDQTNAHDQLRTGHEDQTGPPTDPFSQEVLAELLADLSIDDEPSSVDELARELDYQNHRVPGDPARWQADLESDIAALNAHAKDLPGLLERVTGAAETKRVQVTVNASGGLVDIRFRPGCFGDVASLNADLTTVLAEATHAASEASLAAIRDSGMASEDDATVQMFTRGLTPEDTEGPQ